jgi:hypothetical protein
VFGCYAKLILQKIRLELHHFANIFGIAQRPGHTMSSGTYVQPYVATNPNSTQRDNYGATGNVNPYTGAVGTRNPRY